MKPDSTKRDDFTLVTLLGTIIFSGYALTSSRLYFGYEGLHIAEAFYWLRGGEKTTSPGGILDIAGYLPSAWAAIKLAPSNRFISLQHLLFTFVQPALATLTCIVFFGFARELFRNRRTAFILALFLAFGTMLWPYSKFGMENTQTLWTVASAWALYRYCGSPSAARAVIFAMAIVAMALTKVTGLIHGLAFTLAMLWIMRRDLIADGRRVRSHALLALVVGACGLALLLFSNSLRYGGWLHSGRYNVSEELTVRYFFHSLFGVIFGWGKSIFVFNPILLLGIPYYRLFLDSYPRMKPIFLSLGFVALWYFAQSSHFNDETWGPRRIHFLVPFMILPVGCFLESINPIAVADRLPKAALAVVLIFSLGVQILAILFNYTSHAFVLGNHPIYSIENNVWDPRLNAIWFNVHLLRSASSRAEARGSIPFVIENHYVPWDAPKEPVPPLWFDVSKQDHFDFWWLQERAFWGGKPYWFSVASSFVFMILAGLFFLSVTRCLYLIKRRAFSVPQPRDRPKVAE